MSRPISEKLLPKLLVRLQEAGFNNVTELANHAGLHCSTLRNLLYRNQHKTLITYLVLAKALGITVEELGAILLE